MRADSRLWFIHLVCQKSGDNPRVIIEMQVRIIIAGRLEGESLKIVPLFCVIIIYLRNYSEKKLLSFYGPLEARWKVK
jgi:hypothetical protein